MLHSCLFFFHLVFSSSFYRMGCPIEKMPSYQNTQETNLTFLENAMPQFNTYLYIYIYIYLYIYRYRDTYTIIHKYVYVYVYVYLYVYIYIYMDKHMYGMYLYYSILVGFVFPGQRTAEVEITGVPATNPDVSLRYIALF